MRLRSALAAAVLAAALPGTAAAAYPWPFRPFHAQHPIRGFFGDPRTVFRGIATDGGIEGPGAFSFHQGVDIAAPDGTPIYSVSDGTAHYLGANTINVVGRRDVTFQYFHIVPIVGEGQRVVQSRTILGYVEAPFGHVHLTEIDGTHAVNPLAPGHLTPYRDTTRPTIEAIAFSNALGPSQPGAPLCGRVEIDAQASDTPPLPVPGAFHGFPVSPALVTWSIARPDGGTVVPSRVTADFRHTLPPRSRFWDVYARGTYENAPRFGFLQYGRTPGRYLFRLAGSFDTRQLRDGAYVLVVRAADVRGNAATLRERFSVLNTAAVCPGSLPADPRAGEPPAPAPVLLDAGSTPPPGSEEPPGP